MRCESCGKPATQIRDEYSYCDRCWAANFSKTGGVPFRTVLKDSLERMGLMREDGEAMNDWVIRLKAHTPRTLNSLIKQ